MSKQVISVHGQDEVVREDTAKAFRGTHWALLSIGAFILITAILFFAGVLKLASESKTGTIGPPAGANQSVR